jgi:branched-chain amino acid transport system ATP-binding protein
MLTIKNAKAGYGKMQVLNDISLEVGRGSVALIGPNGAGKTTLINTILGLVPLTEGKITFDFKDVTTRPTHERVRMGISLVPQERELFPFMSVYENLVVGGENTPRGRDDIEESLDYVHGIFPILKERHGQLAGTMSGGQQRMLAVGRALMARPKLLILDEPSLGLQPSIVHELFDILTEMKERVSILVTEQNVRESLRSVDRGYVLENGKIVLEGSAAELASNPEVEKAYLGL